MIFLNFKTYPQTSGNKAIKLCRLIKNTLSPITIVPCPQISDIPKINLQVDIPIWAQHLDPKEIIIQKNHLTGTLLNHSNHPLDFQLISQTVKLCHHHHLKVMVITDTLEMVKKVTKLNPDYLGFEDPQFIGGPIPMVQAHPDLISKAVALSRQPLVVGGGIRSAKDVAQALKLGAKGILVASEFAQSSNHQKTLYQLLAGYKSHL